jgi:hypothetical protein
MQESGVFKKHPTSLAHRIPQAQPISRNRRASGWRRKNDSPAHSECSLQLKEKKDRRKADKATDEVSATGAAAKRQ